MLALNALSKHPNGSNVRNHESNTPIYCKFSYDINNKSNYIEALFKEQWRVLPVIAIPSEDIGHITLTPLHLKYYQQRLKDCDSY